MNQRVSIDIDRCSRCGLCLEVCPTYLDTLHEGEGPRGRLKLIGDRIQNGGGDGDRYLDTCLKCAMCETVCPTHVPYHVIIRQDVARHRQIGITELEQFFNAQSEHLLSLIHI